MRAHNKRNLAARAEIEAARTFVDNETSPLEIGVIARDAHTEGRHSSAVEIIASIPPVTLSGRTYTVVAAGGCGMTLVGPRGGECSLIQNQKRPELWALVKMSGFSSKTTWYKRTTDGAFVEF